MMMMMVIIIIIICVTKTLGTCIGASMTLRRGNSLDVI